MRPKYSSGYLTPQTKKSKRTSKVKRTESNENFNMAKDLSDSFFEKLMSCPVKRQLVLTLINSEKDNIEEYKRNRAKEDKRKEVNASPLSKIKRNHQCESPTALLRRRALEQKNHQNGSEDQGQNPSNSTSRSSSRQSSVSSCSSLIAFDKLLDGVVAYVEIKSKDQDRSSGAKALMTAMGASIREKFTKDVTHVIFKDGSFTTYQKAKLMKVHLVSVLWIEAVRSNNMRVPEKKFPALGTESYDNNVSAMCSQMQKEYEGLIRDELQRSLVNGTPLPSTQTLIDRRRTLMTPIPSNRFSQEFPSSQDAEVDKILHSRRKTYSYMCRENSLKLSPQLTSDDDSDLGPFIDGTNIRRRNNSVFPNLLKSNTDLNFVEDSNMDLTFLDKSTPLRNNKKPKTSNFTQNNKDTRDLEDALILNDSFCDNVKEHCVPNISTENIYHEKTPKLKKSIERRCKPKEDEGFVCPEDALYKRKTTLLRSDSKLKLDGNANSSYITTVSISELTERSSGLQILSKNVCNTNRKIVEDNAASFSNIASTVTGDKSSSTNMSSLQISLNKENVDIVKANQTEGVSTSTNMSALLVSSDSNQDKSTDIASHKKSNNNILELDLNKKSTPETGSFREKESFSPINSVVMKEVLQILDMTSTKDENVTKRRKKQSAEKRTYNTRRSVRPPDIDMTENDNDTKSEKDLSTKPSPAKKAKSSLCISPQKKIDHKLCTKSEHLDKGTRIENDLKESDQRNNLSADTQLISENKNRNVKYCTNRNKTLKRTFKKYINTSLSSQVENCKVSDESQNSSEDSESNKKINKTRKLYNPDQSIKEIILNDDSEREYKRNEAKKRKSDEGVVLNSKIVTISPNTILTAKAKEFVDQNKINIVSILNQDLEESDTEAKLPKKRKTKKDVKQILRNSEADEQVQLAAEYVNKHNDEKLHKKATQKSATKIRDIKRRKSMRLSQNPRTQSPGKTNILPVTPVANRRSTMEFQTKSQMSSSKKLKIDKNKRPSIVCTKLHKDDIQTFNQIVRKLEGFVTEDEVSTKTTHLVVGEPKRTINMLRAMAMGCWILKHEWLLRSLEEGKWLPEEDYEETDFSPAVQRCRLQRQAFGPSYSMDVFQDCGPIYIARGTTPRCSDLKELVILCKGNICAIPRNAAIVVGECVRYEEVKCVKESWVLDSITYNKRMPLKKYIITPADCSPIV